MAKADVKAGAAYVTLFMKDNLTRDLRNAQQKMQKFGSDMLSIGRQIATISAVGILPLAAAAKTFANFDDAMRMVKAVTQSTDTQFQQLSDKAKMLGATTSYTAVQVASLMTELGRAGFTAGEIDVMTASVMNLARATGTDATLASGIMAATLRQFALGASEAARVADVLTLAANSTFNTVEGLGESLKYAGPVAKELGMSLEDTVAILGSLGNVGIQGSEAGTALRRLGVISAATGKDLKKIFHVSNVDPSGQLKPLVQIMDEIGKSIQNLPVAQQVAKMNEAFGLLGITSAQVLAGAANDTTTLANKLRGAAGTASDAAKEMDAGLGGAFRIIMSAVEGVAIALGEAISEPLKEAVELGSAFLGSVVKIIGKNKEMVVSFGKVAAIVGAVGVSLMGIGLAFSAVAFAFGGFASVITMAFAILSGIGTILATILSPVGLLVAALVAGAYAWTRFSSSGKEAVTGLLGIVTGIFGGMLTTVTDVMGGIKDAILAGDLDRAGQFAMLGLRLVFAQGIDAIHKLFGETIGTLSAQVLTGDFAGAWSTLGATVLDSIATMSAGMVTLFSNAANAVMNKWQETVNAISDYILQASTEGGAMGWALEKVSGVNMQEEAARGKRIEEERRAKGMKPDDNLITDSTQYQDPALQALKDKVKAAGDAANAMMTDATDATGQALEDATKGQSETASAEVMALQAELAALKKEADTKVAAINSGS